MDGHGEDLAAIHAAGFTEMAQDAARELLGRLPPRARVLELGCGDATTAALLSAVEVLTRRIVTFRDTGDGRYRRAEETHRLRLHRPADVLAGVRRAGFSARTLRGGYAGSGLPPGLTGYLGRLRQSVSSMTMRTRW